MTATERNFKTVPAVYLLPLKEDKIILMERLNTGYRDGDYCLVSGHKEAEEKATDAIIREAKEEVGIVVKATDLDFVHVMHRIMEDGENERVDLFFTIKKWEGEIINAEPHKHKDPEWFPIHNLPENTIPFTRDAIENYRQGKYFSEFFEESI